jgi:hypothetical protein
MKKTKIYAWMVFGLGLALTACSNLDESAFVINPTTGQTIIYSETFESGLGAFTQYSDSGTQMWSSYSGGYATISGYANSVNYANVDWLISPEVDLTNVAAAHLTFDHVARYFADVNTEATVMISVDYNSALSPSKSTWVKLSTNPFSDPGAWTPFQKSGEISLSSYVGKKVHIAFKYISSATKAGTWELKNFLVSSGDAVVSSTSIYSNSFGSSKGDFTAISVSGAQTWTYSSAYNCMVGSGYTTVNNANVDWLVSPEIDLTNIPESYVTFDHAGRYFGTPSNDATVWVSENYTDSANFASATWTKLNIMNYFTNTSYTFVNTGNLDLSSFAGKKIRVALKYSSTTSSAGTWEVRNFNVYKGKASGILSSPFTVQQAISYQSGGLAWISGYVVGYSWPFINQYAYFYTPDSCSQITNVILSDSLSGFYSSKCIAVQLPRGGARGALNLKTNKLIYGKKVKVYGTLSSYMGIAGLVNPLEYVLPDGTAGTSGTTNIFSEAFATSLGSFTTNSVTGAQVWRFASGFGASMSGYSSGNVANEDWLISPEIDLTSVSSAAFSFNHTINKGIVANMRTEQTLWITKDNGVSWSVLTIPTYPAGNTWTFVSSGEISLDRFTGNKVKIAFKYISTTTSSATWEINNFKIYY